MSLCVGNWKRRLLRKHRFTIRKTIADAERHRRTPQTSATGGKEAEGEKSAGIGRHRRRKARKKIPKSTKCHQNGYPNRRKGCQKSIKNRGCVAGAFRAAFGGAFSPKFVAVGPPFWTHFGPKVEKKAPKNQCKNRCRKSAENDAKRGPKWSQNGSKI